jgi:hypothetical protein
MAAQRGAEQPPGLDGATGVSRDLAQAAEDHAHAVRFAGRAEQLQGLPEQRVGPAVLALETGGLTQHVIGVSLPGHHAGLRRLGQFALEMRFGHGMVAHPERHLAEQAVRPGQALVVAQRSA